MKLFHPKRLLRCILKEDAFVSFCQCLLEWCVARNYVFVIHRLRRLVRRSAIRVVFYTNEPQKWSYDSLYHELESSPLFDPVVVVVPRYAVHLGKDHTRMSLEEQYDFYKKLGYRVVYGYENGQYLDIRTFKPNIFFYLQLAEVPGVDDPTIVSKCALTCYCPYSFPLTDYRKEYLQRFHRLLYRYYVVHDWTKERFEGYAKGNSKNCVVVGYPKLDVYSKFVPADENKWWRDPSMIRIIYAPHHSVQDPFSFSTFLSTHDVILDLAKKATSTTWVFKPHPMLRRAVMLSGAMTYEELDRYYQSWAEVGRVYDQGDYFDIFKTSDLMITDCASFLAEYLPSGKPLIRLINPKSCPLDKLGSRLSDCYYNVHDENELIRIFHDLVSNQNDYLCVHRKGIAEMLIDRRQTAARKILMDLQKVLHV